MTSEKTHEDERRARLAQALRENLKRRKAQARSRRPAPPPDDAAERPPPEPGRD